jgi:tripartite-type tricarboxylate transporter receptor subunit TctC
MVLLSAAAVWLAAGNGPLGAQDAARFPERPITLVVPMAPGGGVDGLARLLAPVMSEILKQPVVIDNAPGAGGTVGLARVSKAPPDGYTIGFGTVGTHVYTQALHQRPRYDAITDFAPVALLAEQPLVLAARPDLPVSNLKEFLAYAKENQSKMQFGSPGLGTGSHISCVMLNAAAGLDVTHIPYRGGGPAMSDLIAGRIDYWCPFSATAMPVIRNNQIKPLAILSRDRLAVMPELPTAHEQELKNFQASTWNALFASKGTPADIVAILNDAAIKAITDPRVRDRMAALGMDVVAPDRRSSDYLTSFVKRELERWTPAIKASGLNTE